MHVISTKQFSGPLDLLLDLIRKQELEITEVSLSTITGDYLETLRTLSVKEPAELAGFLVVAAKLLSIKSRHLISVPESESEEDGPSLEDQLRQYQFYRDAAEALREIREERGESLSPRRRAPVIEPVFVPISRQEFEMLGDLYQAVLAERLPLTEPEALPGEVVSLAEQMILIRGMLVRNRRLDLARVFRRCQSRIEIIVTFLAVLEILKTRAGRVTQGVRFGAITLEAA